MIFFRPRAGIPQRSAKKLKTHMKREMDLIRLLLLQVESGEKPEAMSDYTEEQILYHCELAIEAGLLDGQVARGAQGGVRAASLRKLTWSGHEFLDAARSETIWNQAKETVKKAGGSWTMEGLKLVLFEFVKQSLIGQ
jgi:hypothetical protein